jgi:hypothetical protein
MQESPRLVEITIKSRGLKKFGERGGRSGNFSSATKLFIGGR